MQKIIVPVVTALQEDESIDFEANERIARFLCDHGVDGILILGSTGEFPAMGFEEKKELISRYGSWVPEGVELHAGIYCRDARETVELARVAASSGMVSSFLITPSYFAMSQQDIFAYYDAFLEQIESPVTIYNYPARTGNSIDPDAFVRLACKHANVVGLKDSIEQPGHTSAVAVAARNQGLSLNILSGYDDQFLFNASFGGAGGVGALANIAPEIWREMVAASNGGDLDRAVRCARYIHELMAIYGMDTNCMGLLKRLLMHRGVEMGPTVTFPLGTPSEDVVRRAAGLLDDVLDRFSSELIGSSSR